MLFRSVNYNDGNVMRPFSLGDILDTQEIQSTLGTVGAGTLTAALIAGGTSFRRTGPVGAFVDTFDTANNIVAALSGNVASLSTQANQNFNPSFQSVTFGVAYVQPGQPQPGASFRWLYINTVAFAMTAAVAANSGVILGNNPSVAASLVRMYLFQIQNGSPQILANAATTNASAVVTGMSATQTNQVSPGMSVYGTGIQALSVVNSVQSGVGVTLSLAATATNNPVALTFTPTITVSGLFSSTL